VTPPIIITGNAVRDPELRFTPQGQQAENWCESIIKGSRVV